MHCSSPLCALLAAAVLLLAHLDCVASLECYKCFSRSDRKTDTCYLGVPTKGLGRDVCKPRGVCIVTKRTVGRTPQGSRLIETSRSCMYHLEAVQICSQDESTTTPAPNATTSSTNSSSTATSAPAANMTRPTTAAFRCSYCHTSLCNLGTVFRPDRVLWWISILNVLLAVFF